MDGKYKVGFIEDRFSQGVIAGVLGWVPQLLFTQTVFWIFRGTKFQYLDFAAMMVMNHRPRGWAEYLFSELVVVIMLAFLGALFALAVKVIKSVGILLKGTLFGAISWFLIYTLFTLFKIEGIYHVIDFKTALYNLIGAAIWGGAMSAGLLVLNRKCGVKN